MMLGIIQFRNLSSRLLSKKIKIRMHQTIILSVVFYERLTLREEPKKDEIVGGWRKTA
jgi:hypothetical protein